jgi:hypothetical protein
MLGGHSLMEDTDQPDLFDYLRRQKPRTKTQTCNQEECTTKIVLKLDKETGIYYGNRTCAKCKTRQAWRLAGAW